ncbi:hypothetical protein DICPUDRAFT_25237 [Dictyostelium purpureum]|uniref:Uncharacterized protein n=1 Tax=Dictyostelium purpureum TaxID=5786 RepID=F0Z6V4_DICPU|nr:uncharacterized protein DICPUDRAFT_25237 [Dictyostelium purpureum]EGC40328.1 hypothetical protein DICPUDRAFT_25237 [Dictyostelium purpureum]|eukprot:XP_003283079.1 hypothetical protein DICPUDRAFT_25237 [Dictyostelium purpureum]
MFELFDIVAGARRNTVENNQQQNPAENNQDSSVPNDDEEAVAESQNSNNNGNNNNTIITDSADNNNGNEHDNDGSDLVSNELKPNGARSASISKFQLNMNKINRNNSNVSNEGSPRNHHGNQKGSGSRSNSVFGESPRNKFIEGFLGPTTDPSHETANAHHDNKDNTTPGGEKTPGEFDFYNEYYTEKGELKLFVKPKKWWQWDTLLLSFSYLSKLSLLSFLVTIVVCAYVSFYIILGNRFIFYNKDDRPKWGLATSIIAGIINEQLLVTVSFCVLTSQFGFKATRPAIPYAAFFSIASIVFTTCGRVFSITGTGDFIPKYALVLGNIIIVALVVGIKTFKSKLFCLWIALPYVLLGIILIIYDYFLIKWYIKESTGEFSKSVVRIVIHPLITAFCLLISRFCANQLGCHNPRSVISLMLIPIAFNSFYGRLFGNTMETLSGVVISSSILAALEIVWKCSLRARDSFIVRFLCRCSKNASTIMQQNLPLYTEYQSFEMIYDVTSTFVSTYLVIVYFFTFTNSPGAGIEKQFKIMAIQLAFSIVTEIIVAYVSLAYLKLPIIIPFKKRKQGFLFITIYSFLTVIAFISIRIINVLHGQWIV